MTGGNQTLFNSAAAVYNTFSGNVNISGGTLTLNTPAYQQSAAATVIGNMATAGRTINVGSGGSLVFLSGNTMGDTGSVDTVPFIINQGGLAVNTSGGNVTLGPIVLNGGTLSDFGNGSASYQPYIFGAGCGEHFGNRKCKFVYFTFSGIREHGRLADVWRGQYVQRLPGAASST